MKLDDKKILFITCVNDEAMYKKCLDHINNLEIPESYEVDILAIRDAVSIFEGYNRALSHPHKYKIYLHQDVFLLRKDLISAMIEIFKADSQLGMMGLVGTSDKKLMAEWDRGFFYGLQYDWKLHLERLGPDFQPYSPVYSIDGLFMATQYDIPWRSDVFDDFHLYDRSQSIEFLRRGYKIGIPPSSTPTCTHYNEHYLHTFNLAEYQKRSENMLRVYIEEAKGDPMLREKAGIG